MRVWIFGWIVSVIAMGCVTAGEPPTTTDRQGIAEVRVDVAQLLAASITRVTLEAAGQAQDLTLNPATGTFDGGLILPSGTQSLVASAFSGDMLVGRSQPVSVDVQPGVVTRVLVKILDLTTSTPIYGPIIDSLSFPTTTQAGGNVTFAISVVAPAGDPVSYGWTSDCPDSAFSAPGEATTGWSKPAEGACNITVTATSNGFTVAQRFGIVVFPAGSGTGAVTVNGEFVRAPAMALFFFGPPPPGEPATSSKVDCQVLPGSNASCSGTIASPGMLFLSVNVFDWGMSGFGFGTVDMSDDCGGRFSPFQEGVEPLQGRWLPPVEGGLCILTARAVNHDGVAATLSAAILTRAGSPATPQPPSISASINGCALADASPPTDCSLSVGGGQVSLAGGVSWIDGLPGSVSVTDDCAGPLPAPQDSFGFQMTWTPPHDPGRTCTTTVQATSWQGDSSSVSARYTLP